MSDFSQPSTPAPAGIAEASSAVVVPQEIPSVWREYLPYVVGGVLVVGALAAFDAFSRRRQQTPGASSSYSSSSSSAVASASTSASSSPPHVSALYVYPVKSCAGVRVSRWPVDRYGFRFDRNYMIVREDTGTFVTQRQHPVLALIHPELDYENGVVSLRKEGHKSVAVSTPEDETELDVKVWSDEVKGIDMGDEVAAWLTAVIGVSVRLVKLPHAFQRSPPEAFVAHLSPADYINVIAYPDCFPFLLASEASRAWIEKATQELAEDPTFQVGLNRFRPNIVIDGKMEPFEEDTWGKIDILLQSAELSDDDETEDDEESSRPAVLRLSFGRHCTRCSIPNIAQETATRSPWVNKVLEHHRHLQDKVEGPARVFGVQYVHSEAGALVSVGDQLVIKERVDPPQLD
mmetsp:Transcript_9929/g.30555  ORF Transcript_9929/g.30555 Transcript_9929/m.30555 type:complete len:404 (+) Transcript_9929:102-1313(+)